MSCWAESDLELAAIHVVDLEGVGAPLPSELGRLAEHARSCHRCGELLEGFLDVERRFRAETALFEAAQWVELFPVPGPMEERVSGPEGTPEHFSLAAATPVSPQQASALESLGPGVYRSKDGCYEVALQPHAGGGHWLALVTREPHGPPPPSMGRSARQVQGSEIGLACGFRVYRFDGDRYAEFPALPARNPFLVVR